MSADTFEQGACAKPLEALLTIRSYTGISGDILLGGLATLLFAQMGVAPDSSAADECLRRLCGLIAPELAGCLALRQRPVHGIMGWQAVIELPHAHEHRNLADIGKIIANSGLEEKAKQRAVDCFELLAECEAAAHGADIASIHFHEIGALDSILDICGVCELYCRLGEPPLICSPLPVADGVAHCAHGVLPAPAPAALRLLNGMEVRPLGELVNAGELLTPTGLALLRVMRASFGAWPEFRVLATSLVYGQRQFEGVANGVIFALGESCQHLHGT